MIKNKIISGANLEQYKLSLEQYEQRLNDIAQKFTHTVCDNNSIFKLELELDIVRCSAKQNNIDVSSLFPIIVDCGDFELKYDFQGRITKIMKAPMERIEFEVTI